MAEHRLPVCAGSYHRTRHVLSGPEAGRDSTRHHRGGKAKAKDAAIDERLAKIGLSSVRVPGKLIVEDVKAAADLVWNALASNRH
jgi:hypothetical protein